MQVKNTSSSLSTGRFTFDVLDVSILFPVAKSEDGQVALPPLSMVLEEKLFTSVLNAVENKHFFSDKNSDRPQMKENYRVARSFGFWRIVGMRIDPCFKRNIIQTECLRQLRLVAQPVVVPSKDLRFPSGSNELDNFQGDAEAIALDNTLHIVYNIPEDRFLGLVTEFDALKSIAGGAATNSKPLGVHPGFAGAAKLPGGGRFKELTHSIIKKFAKGRDPSGMAVMAGFDGLTFHDHGGAWTFALGSVQSGAFTPLNKLALIQGPQLTSQLNIFDGAGPEEQFVPTPKLDASVPGQASIAALQAIGAAPDKIYEAALKVNNPMHVAQGDSDCVSCHIAQDMNNHSANVDASKQSALSAKFEYKGRTGYTLKREPDISKPQRDMYAFRMFGQFESSAFASPRTLNESIEVAQVLNTLKPLLETTDVEFVSLQNTALKATTDATGKDTSKRCSLTVGQKIQGRIADLHAPAQHWKVRIANPPAGCQIKGDAFLFGEHIQIVAPMGDGTDCPAYVVKKGGARAFSGVSFSSTVLGTLAAGTKITTKTLAGGFIQGSTSAIPGQSIYVASQSLECSR